MIVEKPFLVMCRETGIATLPAATMPFRAGAADRAWPRPHKEGV